MEFQPIIDGLPMILEGIKITLIALVFGSLIGIVLGFCLGIATMLRSRILAAFITGYVYILRGIPELVLLFLIFFGLPMIGLSFPALQAGIIALGLQSSAYILEVVRAGLESVGPEQHEAAALDGAGRWGALWKIVLPQSVRQMIPGVVNQVIGLLKSTSLLAVISVGEATRALQLITARAFVPLEAYLTLAVIYLLIIAVITRASRGLERYIERAIA